LRSSQSSGGRLEDSRVLDSAEGIDDFNGSIVGQIRMVERFSADDSSP
jgi:hypothetical protein